MTAMLRASVALVLLSGAMSAQVLLNEPFNNNNAGWTLGAEWQIGAATASPAPPTGNPDPGVDGFLVAGGGIAGAAIGGTVTTALHGFEYITSPVVDASGAPSLHLEFDRWLNSDYPNYMNSIVEVFDGANWVTIFGMTAFNGIYENSWSRIAYDISAYANAALQVRFGHNVGQNGVYTVTGWNIDNVVIRAGARPQGVFERFNNNNNGWSLDQDWQIGPAATGPTGVGFGDPAVDGTYAPGAGLAGVVIGGDAPTNIHGFYYLTSPAVDTTAAPAASLVFRRWLQTDYLPYMESTVEVFDGSSWVLLYTNGNSGNYDTDWSTQSYDLTPYSNPWLRVRFGFQIGSTGVYSVGSWSVDEIRVGSFDAFTAVHGTPCIPSLTVSAPDPVLGAPWSLNGAGGPPNTFALLLVGNAAAPTPIVGSSCTIDVAIQFGQVVPTDGVGGFGLSFFLPFAPDLLATEVAVQAAYIGPFGVATSNALIIGFGNF